MFILERDTEGKKCARAGRIEKCIVQFADTCIYMCVDVSAVFSNSPRRVSGFNIHIVLHRCLRVPLPIFPGSPCLRVHVYDYFLVVTSSAKVHHQQTSSCNPPDIHFSSRAPQQHLPMVAAIPFQRPEEVPQRVIKHDSDDQNPPSVMSHVLPS